MADTTGIRSYFLRRHAQGTLTTAELEAIADKAAAASLAGSPTVDITMHSADGASASGMVSVSTKDLLDVVTEVLSAVAPVATTQTRQMFVPANFVLAGTRA
jgi:hypothetical protein